MYMNAPPHPLNDKPTENSSIQRVVRIRMAAKFQCARLNIAKVEILENKQTLTLKEFVNICQIEEFR